MSLLKYKIKSFFGLHYFSSITDTTFCDCCDRGFKYKKRYKLGWNIV